MSDRQRRKYELYEFIVDLKAYPDHEAQWRLFRDKAAFLGFDKLVYAFLPSLSAKSTREDLIWMDGYPKEWRTHYEKMNFLEHDVVIKHCLNNNTPLYWSDFVKNIEKEIYTPGEARVVVDAVDFGLKHGISFPVSHTDGTRGGVSFSLDAKINDREILEYQHDMRWQLQAMADIFHAMTDRSEMIRENIKLTPRELECLKWLFEGYQCKSVAEKMGISNQSVGKHNKKLRKKLHATTTYQLIANAVKLGLIR